MGLDARAIVSDGNGGFADAAVDLADPEGGEVLVRIGASGVCHTDLDSLGWGSPLIVGHEGAGVVVACGPGVTHVGPGDRVLLNWAIPCGSCVQCGRGAENLCEQRPYVPSARYGWSGGKLRPSFGLGTMATHALVPRQAVVKIEVEIPFAVRCDSRMRGDDRLRLGDERGQGRAGLDRGGAGLRRRRPILSPGRGARRRADDHRGRRQREPAGARQSVRRDAYLIARRDDAGLLEAAKQVKALIGRGADYAFECTAVPALGAAPLAMVANGGVAVAVSGIEQVVPIDMQLFEFDKLYINPLYGQCRPFRDFPMLLGLYAEGRLKLDEMVTRTYPLSAAGLTAAFADMKAGVGAKGVLLPGAR